MPTSVRSCPSRAVAGLLVMTWCLGVSRPAGAQDLAEEPPAAAPQNLPPWDEATPSELSPAPGQAARGPAEPPEAQPELPPAKPTAWGRARWGLVGSTVMLVTHLWLLPCLGMCALPVGYALGALLIIPASLTAGLVFALMRGQLLAPQDARVLLGLGITAAAFSFIPGVGAYAQVCCLGPAACLTVPAVMLVLFPLLSGVGGAAGRAVTHKVQASSVGRAGLRAALVTAAVAWPLAGAVALMAVLGGLTWGAGSLVFMDAYAAGDTTNAEQASRRRSESRRYNNSAQWFFLGGSVLAALGGALVLGGGLVLLPTVLLPLLEAVGEARDARGDLL